MKRYRFVAVLLAMVAGVVGFVMAGGSAETEGQVVPLKVFRGGVTFDWDEDPIVLELNRRLNVDIEFVTSGWGEIGQVRNLFLASGEVVDIVHHMDTGRQWVEDEAIIPLNELIDETEHPYLYSITHAETFAPMRRNGDSYYIPMVSHGSDWALGVRQDWMDELALDTPTDEEDFADMLAAFRDRDPNGTAVGYQVEGSGQIKRSILPILCAFGVPTSFYDVDRNFFIENGRLRPVATADETREALEYLNELYNDQLINRDFPQMSSFPMMQEKYLLAGQAGAGWFQNPINTESQLAEAHPGAQLSMLPPFSASGHEFTKAVGLTVNGWISVMNGTEAPQKAIELLEYVNTREGRELMILGVEGTHFTDITSDGYFTRDQEAWSADYEWPDPHLWFYFGQGLMHGYVPVEQYGTFEEALANVILFDSIEYRDTRQGYKPLIPVAGQWTGGASPFQFVHFPELTDLQAEINDVITVGWTSSISAAEGEFDDEWNAFVREYNRIADEWIAAYQDYHDSRQ